MSGIFCETSNQGYEALIYGENEGGSRVKMNTHVPHCHSAVFLTESRGCYHALTMCLIRKAGRKISGPAVGPRTLLRRRWQMETVRDERARRSDGVSALVDCRTAAYRRQALEEILVEGTDQ
jgi:hypothetical protein